METIGSRVKALRKAKRLTQASLAKLCNVTQPSINKIESGGTHDVKGTTLERLAFVLETTETHLLYGTTVPSENLSDLPALFNELAPADKYFLIRIAKGLLIQDLAKSFNR